MTLVGCTAEDYWSNDEIALTLKSDTGDILRLYFYFREIVGGEYDISFRELEGNPVELTLEVHGSDGICVSEILMDGVSLSQEAFIMNNPCPSETDIPCIGGRKSITIFSGICRLLPR